MMKRLAAALTLIALTFSLAETARAAACDQNVSHTQHSMPGHSQSAPTPANCPLSGTACTIPVSIPSVSTAVESPMHEVTSMFSFDDVRPHSVQTTAIFHPPRF